MKKNPQKLLLSPKTNIKIKSPLPNSRNKISSPINSYRPASRSNHKITKLIRQIKIIQKLIWIPNPMLYSFIHSLQNIQGIEYMFCLSISNKSNNKKIQIISNIDAFAQIYMQLNNQIKVQCQKWYIISNAVNCKQTQQQFNQIYSPIQFIFIPTISAVSNVMLRFSLHFMDIQVVNIYDLGLNSSKNYLSIEESLIQNTIPQPNCLYIISDAKQWMMFSSKINKYICPYFLTGSEQFRNNKISIKAQQNKKNVKYIYIIFQFEINLAQIKGFESYQKNFIQKIKNPTQIYKLNCKNQVYISKIIYKFLIPQNKICLFYDPLSRLTQLQIAQIRQKLPSHYYFFQSSLYLPSDNCYKLKWNTLTKSCQQLTINTTIAIPGQIKKIQSYIAQKNSLINVFKKHAEKLKKMQVLFYNKNNRNPQKDKENSCKHLVSSILNKFDIKVGIIDDLQCLVQTHRITLIYGYFSYVQVKSVQKFYNVFLVPLNKESQQIVTFNQISQTHLFLQTALNSYDQLHSTPSGSPLQYFIHILYETQTQIYTLLSILRIPEQILKTHYILNFSLQLCNFRQNSKHLVIAPMDIFSEQLESQIREYQWKYNSITIEVYLKYCQQFIERSKEGGYKFIKAGTLQERINQINNQYNVLLQVNKNQKQKNKLKLDSLQQVQKMNIAKQQLQNLKIQQSQVSIYEQNKNVFEKQNQIQKQQFQQIYSKFNQFKSLSMDTQKMNGHYDINKKANQSFIQLFSKSQIQNSQIKQNSKKQVCQIYRNTENQSLFEKQKQILMQQLQNNLTKIKNQAKFQDYQLSINLQISSDQKSNITNLQIKSSTKYSNRNYNKLDFQQGRKKQKQKVSYIKQYKQFPHSPLKNNLTPQQKLLQNFIHKTSGSQFYKLYIFIHRSVPHHSFARRNKKQYHILLYTRLEQILVFVRYSKQEEKIVVIANEQSRQIYCELVVKSRIKDEKLNIIYSKDLSQNFIRKQIDKILSKQKLQQTSEQPVSSKKFKGLVIYSTNNQRAQKAIKIVKKILGIQIKLYFIKQKQYEEMLENKFRFKLNDNVRIYRIGESPKQHQIGITSIRSLFILAMHPDLKNHTFELTNLYFSIQSYIGRLIYKANEKNYVTAGKTLKNRQTFRKKIQAIKSQTNLFKPRQASLFPMKSQSTQKRKSIMNPRKSIIAHSSTARYHCSSSIQIIVSQSLREGYHSKLLFLSEDELLQRILTSYSSSKLAIVIISERQFDIFQLFQNKYFEQMNKQVIWIVQTKIQGKQVFVTQNIIYSTLDNIKEAVQNVIKQYQKQVYFQDIKIQSQIQTIKSVNLYKKIKNQYKSQYQKTLNLKIIAKISQQNIKNILKTQTKNTLIITLNKGNKNSSKLYKNMIEFPTIQSIKKFYQLIKKIFEGNLGLQNNQNIASLMLIPHKQIQKIAKSNQISLKKNIIYKTYDPYNLCTAISYSIFRTIIIVDKQNQYACLRKCTYALQLQKNSQKIDKLLAATLI